MFRKAVLWSLLTTFSLLNVAGEALHQAVFLGSHLPSKADLRGDCGGHAHGHAHGHIHQQAHAHRHAFQAAWLTTDLRQAGKQLPSRPSRWSQQETAGTTAAPHVCLLCQYFHQSKSHGQRLVVAIAPLRIANTRLAETSLPPTSGLSAWFARGPPVV